MLHELLSVALFSVARFWQCKLGGEEFSRIKCHLSLPS
jgi:hypothetical protein